MRKAFFNRIIFGLAGMCLLVTSRANAKTCVLSLYHEARDERAVEIIDQVYKDRADTDYFRLASSSDIEKCFKSSEYWEIVWLSHGMSRNETVDYSAPLLSTQDGTRFPLLVGFFKKLVQEVNYQNLKVFRIQVCNVDFSGNSYRADYSGDKTKYSSSIDLLMRDLVKHGVKLDISPRSWLASWVSGQDVTAVDGDWMKNEEDVIN